MNTFRNFKDFNEYIGLDEPIDKDIDVGVYPEKTRLRSEGINIDFYRISFKTNYINPELPDFNPDDPKPITAVFFNNPGNIYKWDLDDKFEGYYLHLSKDLISKHRYLFQNYLEYGYHEALFLTKEEETEVINLYQFLVKHYRNNLENYNVLLASINLILNMVESYYRRQFKTDIKVYSPIVSEFQQLLKDYYNGPIEGIPSVHYFADKMHLTPNYLGDVIKTYTHKSTIETIHEHVAERAKILLKESNLSNTEIAFELGFDYPNYFAKFFKKQTQLTPKQFRAKFKLLN
ncbi:helix-turn-helix domain-containing protein [Zhouia amylolytica]|uniref:helix-turn-helix domain-containing protein n=1 Tax=Zhouia amylolytica TaxID=376730 RepID=UPI0020CF726F|nr:helix-turn-helix domain-containing protein [Zhouia amylolytica]MCQ0112256.1 AraC family transcriptional regulator [Zhouia amylolytica]